jgi:hypothetical protein
MAKDGNRSNKAIVKRVYKCIWCPITITLDDINDYKDRDCECGNGAIHQLVELYFEDGTVETFYHLL